jgi:hypothetical protein
MGESTERAERKGPGAQEIVNCRTVCVDIMNFVIVRVSPPTIGTRVWGRRTQGTLPLSVRGWRTRTSCRDTGHRHPMQVLRWTLHRNGKKEGEIHRSTVADYPVTDTHSTATVTSKRQFYKADDKRREGRHTRLLLGSRNEPPFVDAVSERAVCGKESCSPVSCFLVEDMKATRIKNQTEGEAHVVRVFK